MFFVFVCCFGSWFYRVYIHINRCMCIDGRKKLQIGFQTLMYKRKYSEKSNIGTLVGLDKGFKTFSLEEIITDVAVFCFLFCDQH